MENEEKNNWNFANKVFNRQNALILGGRNSRISLYFIGLWLDKIDFPIFQFSED